MAMTRKQVWLSVLLIPPALIALVVMGLYAYMTANITPIHSDPKSVSAVTSSAPVAQWTPAVERAQQLARAAAVEKNLPGLSVAVGAGGTLVWAEGFGWADIQNKIPVTPEIRFRTGGVSIPLTSAAVGVLVDKNQLDLDAEVQTYLPTFPKKDWPITLRQVMAHVAGFREDGGDEEPLFSQRCARTTDAFPRFADAKLSFEPGTKYQYSTLGYILVSAIVEAVAGEPFYTVMQKQLFAPLGMKDTTVDNFSEPIPGRAIFYYPKFAADNIYGHDVTRDGDYGCLAGGGGFLSTPSDLVRFTLAFNGGKFLQPATASTLQTAQKLASGESTGYALGWDIEPVTLAGASAQEIGHDLEAAMGGSATLITFPERGLVVAVMANTSFADTHAIALSIADVFAQQMKTTK
jgi:serine beta-lactamase-like protein LACTB, mitochondrial